MNSQKSTPAERRSMISDDPAPEHAMHIGITFDLKPGGPLPDGAPDDLHEEFDSPDTIRAIAVALRELGHTVVELGSNRPMIEALLRVPPEFVFNFSEGAGVSRNREARVPALLEMLGIPYTGSDPLTLALSLDKDFTRRIVGEAGVIIPRGFVLPMPAKAYDGEFAEFPAVLEANELALPVILKPTCEGSSKGIRDRCLIESIDAFGPTVVELWNSYRQPVLVEEFIAGDEVTVGIIGNSPPEILGMMRVVPKVKTDRFVYSLEVKRNYAELVDYECPPNLPAAVLRDLEQSALAAYEAVGCRDVARLDYRIRDGVPVFIEINPLPGLNPISSDLVLIGNAMGVPHAEIVKRILDAAIQRTTAV